MLKNIINGYLIQKPTLQSPFHRWTVEGAQGGSGSYDIGDMVAGALPFGHLIGDLVGDVGITGGKDAEYQINEDLNGNVSFTRGSGPYKKYRNEEGENKSFVDHVYWNANTGDTYYLDPETNRYTKLDTTGLDTSGGLWKYASDDQLDAISNAIANNIKASRGARDLEAQKEAARASMQGDLSTVTVPTQVTSSALQQQEYEKRKQEANALLQKMLVPEQETQPEDTAVYYKYGPNQIDLKYYLHNLGTNLQKYLDSQDWSQAQKNAFMQHYNAYKEGLTEQLANNSERFSTDDAGMITDATGTLGDTGSLLVDANGNIYGSADEIQDKKLRRSAVEFSPGEEVRNYLNTIGQAIVGSGKVKDTSDSTGDFNLDKHGFVRYWSNKRNPSGGDVDMDPIWALDPTSPEGKRDTTNRTKYLAFELQNYLNHITKGNHNFAGTGYKTKDAYISRIQKAIDNLNNGWDNTDASDLQAIGITPDFYSTFMTDKPSALMSDEELSAEMLKRKETAASEYIETLKNSYDTFAQANHTRTWNQAQEVAKDYRYDPETPGAAQKIGIALEQLGFPVDQANAAASVDTLWEMAKTALRSGQTAITTRAGSKDLNTVLRIIFPTCEKAFKESASNPGVKYLDDPENDARSGAILCLKQGKLYYDFIGNVKECQAWQQFKENFNRSYTANPNKPKYSFDKLGGVLRKLQEGGSIDPEVLAALQQMAGADLEEEAAPQPSGKIEVTENRTPGQAFAEALYGPREAAAQAKGLSLQRYNQKQRSPNADPDFFNKDNGEWKTEDYVRLGAIAADLVSIPLPSVYGAAAGGVGTIANLWADWADDSVTTTELLKNLGMNLGMDALSIIPVVGDFADAGRLTKNLIKMAPKISYALSAYGILATLKNGSNIMESLQKVGSDEKLTVGDYQNIAQGIAALAGVSGGIKAGMSKKLAKNKALNKDAVGIGLKKNGEVKDFIFQGEHAKKIKELHSEGKIDELNTYIKNLEGFSDYEINTYTNTNPVKANSPISFKKGEDGKRHLSVEKPFEWDKRADVFDVYNTDKYGRLKGYGTHHLLQSDRQLLATEASPLTKTQGAAVDKAHIDQITAETKAIDEGFNKRMAAQEDKLFGTKGEDGKRAGGLEADQATKKVQLKESEQQVESIRQEIEDLKTKYGVTSRAKPKRQLDRVVEAIDRTPIDTEGKIYIESSQIESKLNEVSQKKEELKSAKGKARSKKKQAEIEKDIDDLNTLESLLKGRQQQLDQVKNLRTKLSEEEKIQLDLTNAIKDYDANFGKLRQTIVDWKNGTLDRHPHTRAYRRLQDVVKKGTGEDGVYRYTDDNGNTREIHDIQKIFTDLGLFKKGGRLQFLKEGKVIKAQEGDVFTNPYAGATYDPTRYRNVFRNGKWFLEERTVNNTNNRVSSNNEYDTEFGTPAQTKVREQELANFYDQLNSNQDLQTLWGNGYMQFNQAPNSKNAYGQWMDSEGNFSLQAFDQDRTSRAAASNLLWGDQKSSIGHDVYKGKTYYIAGKDGEFYKSIPAGYKLSGNHAWTDDQIIDKWELVKDDSAPSPTAPVTPTPTTPVSPDPQPLTGIDPSLIGEQPVIPGGANLDPELLSVPTNIQQRVPSGKSNRQASPTKVGLFNKLGELAPEILDFARLGYLNDSARRLAKQAIKGERPILQDPVEHHRAVFGNFRAKAEGEKAAASLKSIASRPITSDGSLQTAAMLEAQNKGQQYIDAGNKADDEMIRNTMEASWQQEKENKNYAHNVAMQNRVSLLQTAKNINNIIHGMKSTIYNNNDIKWQDVIKNAKVAQAERKTLADDAAAARIKLAVQHNPNGWGANLSSQELAVWKRAQAGETPSGMSAQDQERLIAANKKVSLAMTNQYYGYKGIPDDQWTADANTFSKTKASFTPTLLPVSKDGSKLAIARIRNKAKNSDRFQKSVQKQLDSLDKKLDRISKSMYGHPKVEVIKAK